MRPDRPVRRHLTTRGTHLIAAFFGFALAGCAEQPCGPAQLDAIVQLHPAYGHFTMPMTLNGHDIDVIVDTGAQWTVLVPEAVKASHGFSVDGFEAITLNGLGGPVPTDVVQFDTVEVAGGSVHDAREFVATDETRAKMGDADGALGSNLLGNWDVDLDAAQSRLRLYTPRACRAVGPDWRAEAVVPWRFTRHGTIHFPLAIDGRDFDAMLDTGTPVSVVQSGDISVDTSADRVVTLRGVDQNRRRGRVHRFGRITIAGHAFGPAVAAIAPFQNGEGIDMILGLDFFRHRRLFIAYKAGLLFIGPRT